MDLKEIQKMRAQCINSPLSFLSPTLEEFLKKDGYLLQNLISSLNLPKILSFPHNPLDSVTSQNESQTIQLRAKLQNQSDKNPPFIPLSLLNHLFIRL